MSKPDTNPDAVKLLSDDEVAEIATRPWVYPYLHNTEQRVLLKVAERDALCATVRALRAENELADKVFKLILPNRPLATISELAKPVLDEVDALREQLAQKNREINSRLADIDTLQSQLSQARQERDEALSEVRWYGKTIAGGGPMIGFERVSLQANKYWYDHTLPLLERLKAVYAKPESKEEQP